MDLMANPWKELSQHWAKHPPPGFKNKPLPLPEGWQGAATVPGLWNPGSDEEEEGVEGPVDKYDPLLVKLLTDCDSADTWYEAK